MWPTVSGAVDFALGLQAPGGAIHWAVSPEGNVDPMALLTGSCSIYMSLKCALAIARMRGGRPAGVAPRLCGGLATPSGSSPTCSTSPNPAFPWTGSTRSCPAPWSGIPPGRASAGTGKSSSSTARASSACPTRPGSPSRKPRNWCWPSAPWKTGAWPRPCSGGSCDKRFDDGTYWCGFTYPDMVVWPEEKITWTNAVVLMAADALYHLSPAGQIFGHAFLERRPVSGNPVIRDHRPYWVKRLYLDFQNFYVRRYHPPAPAVPGRRSSPS